jgi:hypothetical protein
MMNRALIAIYRLVGKFPDERPQSSEPR